jgi:ligand-binding sensor domain-containing protein
VDHGDHELYWKGANVTALATDRQGRLWAGTSSGAMRLVNGQHEPAPLSAELTHVTAIAVDSNDHVWLYDAARGLFRWFNGHTDDFTRESLVQGKSILSAAADSHACVWFGLSTGGIVVFESGAFHAFSGHDGLPESSVTSIADDDDGTIWIGTDAGLSRFDGSKFVTWTTGALDGSEHGHRLLQPPGA